MKKKVIVGVGLIAGLLLVTVNLTFAGYGKKAEQPAAAEQTVVAAGQAAAAVGDQAAVDAAKQEMMARFKDYSTPNENHRVLDAVVGDWTYTSKHWMASDASVQESTGTAQAKWILDGHFVQQDVQGDMMGQPFTGVSLIGFDNIGKEYQSVWYNNMGTGMMVVSGKYDAAAKTITQGGNFYCPLTDGQRSTRWVTKFIDANTYAFEMWMVDEAGKDFKSMEIVYSKKQ